MLPLPEAFTRNITELFGEEGRAWLDQLPALVASYERRWEVRAGAPYALSYNYVVPAVGADGARRVLKLGVPRPDLSFEIAAVAHHGGRGMARLVEADPEGGALLLERLEPGTPLWSPETGDDWKLSDDEAATRVAASVMLALRRPPPAAPALPFPTIKGWASGLGVLRERYGGGTGPLPTGLVERAERAFEALVGTTPPLLLHGDLHHGNILKAGANSHLAIDPHGVVGDAGFEVGAFLHNPTPNVARRPDLSRLLERRVAVFAETLGMDPSLVVAWGVAYAVLSAWWSLDGHGHGWEPAITVAARLGELSRRP